MNIGVTSVKVLKAASQETLCFEAKILIEGMVVGTVCNEGHGGANHYRFNDRALEKAFHEFCESQPPVKSEVGDLPMDADLYIGGLVDDFEERKALARWCKTKTVFRLPGDKTGDYRTVKAVFTPEVRAWLVAKYGDKVEILNAKVA